MEKSSDPLWWMREQEGWEVGGWRLDAARKEEKLGRMKDRSSALPALESSVFYVSSNGKEVHLARSTP